MQHHVIRNNYTLYIYAGVLLTTHVQRTRDGSAIQCIHIYLLLEVHMYRHMYRSEPVAEGMYAQ